MSQQLLIYTIYGRPSDYPTEFVCRRWNGYAQMPTVLDTSEPFARGKTLDEVRRQLPAGLTNIGRERMDDPVIVESWV